MNKQESPYRWVIFCAVLFVFFFIIHQRTAPGLITDKLMAEFNISAATIGLMSSIQFFAYSGLQIPVGLLSDRYGPNRFLIMGALINGIGGLLFSLAPNEYIMIFSRLLVGIGDAMMWLNIVLILSQWFKPDEFVKLLGISGLVSGFGSLSATIPLSLLISFLGWKIPFVSIASIVTSASVLLFFILVRRPNKMLKEVSISAKSPVKRESIWRILSRVVTSRQAWATFLCHFGAVGTYVGFIGSWAVPYGMDLLGLSRSEASTLIMYGLFGTMIGGPSVGWLTGKIQSMKRLYMAIQLIIFLSWIGLFLTGINPPLIFVVVLFFVIGFGNGGASLTFAIVQKSFSSKEIGVMSGFSNMGGFVSAIFLPILFGYVLDSFSPYSIYVGFHYGFLISILFSFIGLLGSILINGKMLSKEINTSN